MRSLLTKSIAIRMIVARLPESRYALMRPWQALLKQQISRIRQCRPFHEVRMCLSCEAPRTPWSAKLPRLRQITKPQSMYRP